MALLAHAKISSTGAGDAQGPFVITIDSSGAKFLSAEVGYYNGDGTRPSFNVDSKGNTWTMAKRTDNGIVSVETWHVINPGSNVGSGHQITVIHGGTALYFFPTISFSAFDDPVTSYDSANSASNTNNGTSVSVSATAGQASNLMIAACVPPDSGGAPDTAPNLSSPWNLIDKTGMGGLAICEGLGAYFQRDTVGSTTAAYSAWSTSGTCAAQICTYNVASTFGVTVAETSTLTDTPASQATLGAAVAETSTLTDTPATGAVNYGVTVAETSTLTDTPASQAVMSAAVAETSTGTETDTNQANLNAAVGETSTLTDTVLNGSIFNAGVAETSTLTDTVSQSGNVSYDVSVAETSTVQDHTNTGTSSSALISRPKLSAIIPAVLGG